MGMKERALKKMLTEKDEDKQMKFITIMAKRLSTAKLKKGYRNLKHSTKPVDIKAREVMEKELISRGEKV